MLPRGGALIVGGTGESGTLTSAEIYSLADGTFTEVPTGLTTAVSGLTATVLGDNTVLLAGGLNGSGAPVASAELYDPSQNAFVALPKMIKARSHHTATLLNNGTVLIAGGRNSAGPLASLEIFNPSSRTFTAAAALKPARQDHTATLLTDGTVLIAGGSNSSGPLASAEIYNPATNKVTETGSLSTGAHPGQRVDAARFQRRRADRRRSGRQRQRPRYGRGVRSHHRYFRDAHRADDHCPQRPPRSDPALQRQGVDRGRHQRRRAGRRERTLRSYRPGLRSQRRDERSRATSSRPISLPCPRSGRC